MTGITCNQQSAYILCSRMQPVRTTCFYTQGQRENEIECTDN